MLNCFKNSPGGCCGGSGLRVAPGCVPHHPIARSLGAPNTRAFRVVGQGSANHRKARGFTLIEMMIVISIIIILTAIAVPIYKQHVLRAREAVLKEDLYSMRQSIDQFTQDKDKAPQALDDLVSAGYMRQIPKDPFTDSDQTWEPVTDDSIQVLGQTDTGISDVHSGSKQVGSDGTAYNTW